tara:strand:+ start:139 stop:1050 length:912 start_codon:yes stop_codon:yes gene_type:complete
MGQSVSRQNVESVQTSINRTINNSLNETNNSTECKSSVEQTLKINLGDITISGNSSMNIGQTSKVNMMCFIDNVTQLSDSVKKNVENLLGNESSLKSLTESSGITLDSGQKTELGLKVNQYIENSLENNIENIINNVITLDQSASNTLLFNAGAVNIKDGSSFNLSQDAVIELIAQTSSESMVDKIIDETNTSVIDNKAEVETTIIDEGFDPLGALSSMFSSWITWVAIGGIILLLVLGYILTNDTFNETAQQVAPAIIAATPQGRAATMAKGVTGGAKRYFNKTTIDFVLLLILSYIAIRVN